MKAGGWAPKALVVVPEAQGNGQQELQYLAGAMLALREEADAEALAMAQRWVNERLAGHPYERVID